MICGAAIASRSGLHSRCGLEDNHKGSCMPVELITSATVGGGAAMVAARAAEWTEAAFMCHLLAIVQSAGETLTYVEALNVARGLLRARIGLEVQT